MHLLASIGVGVSGHLAWLSTTGKQPFGCSVGSGFDCNDVLNSPWSRWAGLPVGFVAMVFYAALFVALLFLGPNEPLKRQGRTWRVLILLAAAAMSAAIWFIGLQVRIGSFCPYCMITHGCSLMLAVLIFWHSPLGGHRRHHKKMNQVSISTKSALAWTGMGAFLLLLLIAGQFLNQPEYELEQQSNRATAKSTPSQSTPRNALSQTNINIDATGKANPPAIKQRQVDYGFTTIDIATVPLKGSFNAPHVIMKMFDYTCKHCRDLHHHLENAFTRYGDQFAVVLLPVPLDRDCNPLVVRTPPDHIYGCELAEIALAVWHADPEVFETLHNWLFDSNKPRTPQAARSYAADLIGTDRLKQAMRNPAIHQQIKDDVDLYTRASNQTVLPKLVIGKAVGGPPGSEKVLMNVLEKTLGLIPIKP